MALWLAHGPSKVPTHRGRAAPCHLGDSLVALGGRRCIGSMRRIGLALCGGALLGATFPVSHSTSLVLVLFPLRARPKHWPAFCAGAGAALQSRSTPKLCRSFVMTWRPIGLPLLESEFCPAAKPTHTACGVDGGCVLGIPADYVRFVETAARSLAPPVSPHISLQGCRTACILCQHRLGVGSCWRHANSDWSVARQPALALSWPGAWACFCTRSVLLTMYAAWL